MAPSFTQMDGDRLNRIEDKIDKMSEAIVAIARAEEKLAGMERTTAAILEKMSDGDKKNNELDRRISDIEGSTKNIVTIFWGALGTLVTAIIGALVTYFMKNPNP